MQVFGTEGDILVPWPWIPSREGGSTKIILNQRKAGAATTQEIEVQTSEWLYGIEADHVAANIVNRQAPAISWADTLGNMKMQDNWRASFGQVFDAEKPGNVETVSRRPLRVALPKIAKTQAAPAARAGGPGRRSNRRPRRNPRRRRSPR